MELRDDLLELTRNASDSVQDGAIACEPDLVDQTTKQMESWILHHSAVGQIVVVLLSQRGLNEYRLDEVLGKNKANGSLRLRQHGTFDRSGRGSHAPRGISLQLLIPTSELLQSAISGYVWLNGRPAFARPLSEFERQLADRLNRLAP
jgi:hypothetical protein